MGCKVFMEHTICTGRYYWKPDFDIFNHGGLKEGTKFILELLSERISDSQLYLALYWPKAELQIFAF